MGIDEMAEAFERRFDADGDGYVYWRQRYAEGYRVSVAERDRFVAAYRARARQLSWVCNGWVLVALWWALSAWLSVRWSSRDSSLFNGWTCLVLYAAVALAMVAFTAGFEARPDLSGRPRISRHMTPRDRRRAEIALLPWSSLAWQALFAVGCFGNILAHFDRHSSLDWVSVGCFVLILMALIERSLRKIAAAIAARRDRAIRRP